ncbi:hypothetical protein RB195_018798 [Necator americanus]|uniref:IF rod domain-containing protein n=1 Tax=Necator americanus TaxID=51031 RepID=A0ABR1CCE3_NECAM
MIRHQLVRFDVLFDEEKRAVQEAEAKTRRNAAVEDTVLHEMRDSYLDLQEEIRRQNDDMVKWMDKTKKTYNAIMARVSGASNHMYLILGLYTLHSSARHL